MLNENPFYSGCDIERSRGKLSAIVQLNIVCQAMRAYLIQCLGDGRIYLVDHMGAAQHYKSALYLPRRASQLVGLLHVRETRAWPHCMRQSSGSGNVSRHARPP